MDEPIAQHINSSGKQSALKYKSGSSWIWLISDELRAPEMLPEDEIQEATVDAVKTFCVENKFSINSKVSEHGVTKGVWVQNDEYSSFGFIPMKATPDKDLPKIMSAARNVTDNPFIQTSESVMRQYHIEQKVAETLKSLVLEVYGGIIRSQKGSLKDVIKVDRYAFYKDEDILKRLEDLKFFDKEKLLVPSEDAKERLIRYAEATYYSSPNKVIIPSSSFQFFQSIEDFKKRPGQLIFLSQDSLRSYLMEKKEEKNIIYTNLSKIYENAKDPFVVRNQRFNNQKPFIVQKVRGDKRETCENVGRKWVKTKINEGPDYEPFEPLDPLPVIVYDTRGRIVEGVKVGGQKVNLLKFGDNKYAVMFYL